MKSIFSGLVDEHIKLRGEAYLKRKTEKSNYLALRSEYRESPHTTRRLNHFMF